MTETRKPFGVRMSDEMKEWLARRAAENHRSMNSEIIAALATLMRAEQSAEAN